MQTKNEVEEECLHGLAKAISGGNLNGAIDNLVNIIKANIRVKIELAGVNQNIRHEPLLEQTEEREMDVLQFWEKNQEEILDKNNCSFS